MAPRRALPLVLALLASVLAACATEQGTPRPVDKGAGASDAGTSTGTSTTSAPTRPRELRFNGADPCTMLTQQQLQALGFTRPGSAGTDDLTGAPTCTWVVNGSAIQVIPVATEGIAFWADGKRLGRPTPIDPILGFPAITVTLPARPLNCDVMVDTADGQHLTATSTVVPGFEERFPEPCEGARMLAQDLVENLLRPGR
ncbi:MULTISPECIES: DUF3558 domain-containing protein [Actinosynnema]|uniref:DUF3558 domain-containing protein n=1 Tax=Actinosynnema TaxID=40566 RepID=UPI0020A2A497|nr:DUF3558 domain-containing protein [Actinosynnema pretiosum]MCP2097404.1 Protein of unknown function (DUF3558) [Actinosynnema pretiosum]